MSISPAAGGRAFYETNVPVTFCEIIRMGNAETSGGFALRKRGLPSFSCRHPILFIRMIVITFSRGSKSLKSSRQKFIGWFYLAACVSLFFTPGCLTRLQVDRPAPPLLDLKDHQPLAVLPVPDAPGYRHSGLSLQRATEDGLKEKNFALVAQEDLAQVLANLNQPAKDLSSDPALLARFRTALGSKILVVGTFLSYRVQKSYISPNITEVWPGAGPFPEYQSLPTYHQGTCAMKVRLQMLESGKGSVVWTAEGTASGPSGSEEKVLHSLIEDLMKDLDPLHLKKE
jgi:hypothetical protein